MTDAARGAGCDLLLYTHSFDGGGAERVMVQLANTWAAAGVRVALVVNLAVGPLRELVRADVVVRGLGQRRGLLAAPAVAAAIRALGPAAMISAMTEQNVAACVARRLARFRGPLVTVEHSFVSDALASIPPARRRLLRVLMCWCYPMADRVSAVSEAAARDLESLVGLPAGAAATLYNPIWPMTASATAPADVHRWLGEPGPVLVAVGRLVAQKNHLNLLRALALMRRQRPVRLVVLGEGPLGHELAAAAAALGVEDAVDFAGFRANVADFLRHADVFVLSSDREGLPLSLMEALSVGTPVVSTDCRSGPRELLEDGRFGALVPVRDPAALAEAVLDALNQPRDPARLRARAAEFGAEVIVRRYEAVLFPGGPPWRRRNAACVPERRDKDRQRARTRA